MAHFDHSFGVEIECYLPEGTSRDELANAINQRVGAGTCYVEGYNHVTTGHWKLVTDGSLSDYTRGVEVVSPVLNGEADLNKVAAVCRAISDFGCTVNKKCGLHVHVGVGDAPLSFWKNLVSLYGVFETVIDKMMPPSRRASANAYCRSMTSARYEDIQACRTFDSLHYLFGGGRYAKVNLASYMRHRTVEFRQHSGTTDAGKVTKWVLLCLRMVDVAFSDRFNVSNYSVVSRNLARPGTKNHLVGEMLLRPEGVTPQEAMAVTGWASISMPEMARLCGINFTSRKTGRITRFFARQAAVQVSDEAFATLLNMDADERSYMQQRINDLSGQIAWAA